MLKLLPVVLPFFVAVLNLAASSTERPAVAPQPPRDKPFHSALRAWHALDGLACLVLMLFEAISAVILSAGRDAALGLVCAIPALFIPYVLVALAARRFLLRAYTILAEEFFLDRSHEDQMA
jgi:hypothetical protein